MRSLSFCRACVPVLAAAVLAAVLAFLPAAASAIEAQAELETLRSGGEEVDASIVDANANGYLATIAFERTRSICSYLTAENAQELAEGGEAVHKHLMYEVLGLAEFAQMFALPTCENIYAGFYTLPPRSPAFVDTYRACWQIDGEDVSAGMSALVEDIQKRAGLSYIYERPVGSWEGDVLVLIASPQSGYATATLFTALGPTQMVAVTYLVRLPDAGDWAGLVTSMLAYDSVKSGTSYPPFSSVVAGDKLIEALPDNGIPSGTDTVTGDVEQQAEQQQSTDEEMSGQASISGYPDAVWGNDERLERFGKWPFSDSVYRFFDSLAGWNVDGALEVVPGALTATDLVAGHVMQDNVELHDALTVHGPLFRAMTWQVVEIVPCDPYRLQERVGGDLYWFDNGYLIYVDCTEASEGETIHTLYAVYALEWGDRWWIVFDE